MLRSRLQGVGSYLPEKILTNKDLAKAVDTTDEWILQRTGIKQRHIAADGEYTSDLATKAAQNALEDCGTALTDIDTIIVATTSPDLTFPSTATIVQEKLGIKQGFAFDIQAACSGFVYALSMADSMIRSGQIRTALVIGAETFSRLVDWEDRRTCVLFGDGAGAVVLKAHEGERGILSSHLFSDGAYCDFLKTTGGPAFNKMVGVVEMNGREVFKQAVGKMAEAVKQCLDQHGLMGHEVDWLIPHQANKRIIDAMGDKLGLKAEQVVVTVDQHANTSAASIPLALDVAVKDGRIKENDLILMEALGAGFTWGSALVRF